MNKIKMFIAKQFFKELLPVSGKEQDASGSSGGGAGRELASEFVKRVTYKENNDTDFEDPDFDLEDIFIDGFMKIVHHPLDTLEELFKGMDEFANRCNVKLILSITGSEESAPEFLKPYIMH